MSRKTHGGPQKGGSARQLGTVNRRLNTDTRSERKIRRKAPQSSSSSNNSHNDRRATARPGSGTRATATAAAAGPSRSTTYVRESPRLRTLLQSRDEMAVGSTPTTNKESDAAATDKKPPASKTPQISTVEASLMNNVKAQKELNRDEPETKEQKDRLVEFCKRAFDIGVQGMLDEYTQLRTYMPPSFTKKAFEANGNKNRYHDVVCLDNTRVVLRDNPLDDYIHANYVKGPPLQNTFICTQGPMETSVGHFLRLVVQENVGNIFMLCETNEEGKAKCFQYWPRVENTSLTFGNITIRNTKVEQKANATADTPEVSTLEITIESKKPHKVTHRIWRTWPDKSVPSSVMAPFRLLQYSRRSKKTTIVHCSAGIGRTGTIVGLELALQHALDERELHLSEVVKKLRSQRSQAVQTDLQYVYMYKCLIAYTIAQKVFDDALKLRWKQFEQSYADLFQKRAVPENQYAPIGNLPKPGGVKMAGTPR